MTQVKGYVGKKATKPQKVSKQLQARRSDIEQNLKSIDSKVREGYHIPGSQNRNK